MTVFDMFRAQLHEFFATLTNLVTGRVSLDRLDNFLREESHNHSSYNHQKLTPSKD
jgi:pyruvate dehydrogenase complex dehydrogenase (E1) component